jgi:hypothetical protein
MYIMSNIGKSLKKAGTRLAAWILSAALNDALQAHS